MALQWNLIIFVPVLWLAFNIKELACKSPVGKSSSIGPRAIRPATLRPGDFNRALNQAAQIITQFPYGISEAVDDASGVFGKVLGKILSKKKFLGIESFYYK